MLASNESASPPLPEVVEAAARVLAGTNRYPDPALRAAAPRAVGRATGSRRRGSRSATARATSCWPPAKRCSSRAREVVYAWPAFSEYPHLEAASGATAIRVPLDADDRHDLDGDGRRDHGRHPAGARSAIPNNPTSTAVGLDADARRFLARVPSHVCVILDEAYCEFALALGDPYASVELLRQHPNLVLLRTFSKVYGLAGLRVGYALCGSEELPAAVNQVRQPFHLNVAAQAAAVEALRHQDEVERRVAQTLAARLGLEEDLRRLGLWVARVGRELRLAARCPRPTTPTAPRPTSSPGCASAVCWSVRGLRWGAPVRCG